MLVHTVLFWLKPEIDPAGVARFRGALEGLREIDSVRQLYVGVPAPTPARSVVDDTYTVALTVIFDDVDGHDLYADHLIHQAFLEKYSGYWERVQVYDAM